MDNEGDYRTTYLAGHPSLRGRELFTSSAPGQPDAAFVRENDPTGSGFTRIQDEVRAGYLVRTRADADTVQARTGDITMRDAALASGAQMVSTDYPVAGIAARFGTSYSLSCPAARPRARPRQRESSVLRRWPGASAALIALVGRGRPRCEKQVRRDHPPADRCPRRRPFRSTNSAVVTVRTVFVAARHPTRAASVPVRGRRASGAPARRSPRPRSRDPRAPEAEARVLVLDHHPLPGGIGHGRRVACTA